jgi:hypothetical protein
MAWRIAGLRALLDASRMSGNVVSSSALLARLAEAPGT